jgi:hypothetical protein
VDDRNGVWPGETDDSGVDVVPQPDRQPAHTITETIAAAQRTRQR